MGRSKRDYFQEGLRLLGEMGLSGLTIENLIQRLQVTKGSFYHHFNNVKEFQNQLVRFWAEQYFSTADGIPLDPQACLDLMDEIMETAFARVTEPEVAIRMWAHEDEEVRQWVEKVDAARRDFVARLFLHITGDENQADLMADMIFVMLIGSMTAFPRVPPRRVLLLYDEFKRLHGLAGINH
jgi:AcrR family transcriptional regulator